MPVQLATKTLEAIENALRFDQGVKFRGLLKELYPLADDIYSQNSDSFRSHLGASLIGRQCSRELWYGFRWSREVKHEGRLIRLFNRGHSEEVRFVALLKMIGCKVWQVDENNKQWKISDVYGHFGGSLDGVVAGLPDIPSGEGCLTEFKTHGEKSFLKLQVEGVFKSKHEHYVQMQIYMHKFGLKHALYMAVNKNTDELYAEIIDIDPTVGERYIKRAYSIVEFKEAPARISNNPSWHECRFCDYKPICHGKDIPSVNCRTCIHSEPSHNGNKLWECRRHRIDLTPEMQFKACPDYEINPQIKKPI